jgi:hypothetical protein
MHRQIDWSDFVRYWNEKPENLRPLGVSLELQSPRAPNFNFSHDLSRLNFNPYKAKHLHTIFLAYRNPQLPRSVINTKILKSLVTYDPVYYDGEYLFAEPTDAQYGAEFLLACLLPLLLGRKLRWTEIQGYQNLDPADSRMLCETLCEKRPDVWWPYYRPVLFGRPQMHVGKKLMRHFKRGELTDCILEILPNRLANIVNHVQKHTGATRKDIQNSVTTSLYRLKVEGKIINEDGIWKPRQ